MHDDFRVEEQLLELQPGEGERFPPKSGFRQLRVHTIERRSKVSARFRNIRRVVAERFSGDIPRRSPAEPPYQPPDKTNESDAEETYEHPRRKLPGERIAFEVFEKPTEDPTPEVCDWA